MECNEEKCNFKFDGVRGNPFKNEQDIWAEFYKLKNNLNKLLKQNKTFYLQSIAQVESHAEILRQFGQSGFLNSRQYDYSFANDVGYNAVNIHNHADFKKLLGSAEFSAILNGYYFRSRHNDYKFELNGNIGDDFLSTRDIPDIPVPGDITGTVAEQTAKVKDYFKALNGEIPTSSVSNFGDAFKIILTYIECWWEVLGNNTISDPFGSPRHQLDANLIEELIARDQYFSYGGHKNTLENIAHFPIAIKDIDDNGNPVYCIFKYRPVCVQIGNLVDYPLSSIINNEVDYLSDKRKSDWEGAKRYSIENLSYSNQNPTKLDELMNKAYGLNGVGSNLEESYNQYGQSISLYDHGTDELLNAARYNRFYRLGNPDASGRSKSRRGFHDPMLFVAKTTRPEVFTRKYDSNEYAFSFAVPFEIHVQTFLDSWNPHNVPKLDLDDITGSGNTESNPLNGYSDSYYYYHTPSDLFSSVPDPDPADTSTTSKWVVCGDSQVRLHSASGNWIRIPLIPGVAERVRTRYPVYPVYREGNDIFEQFEAK